MMKPLLKTALFTLVAPGTVAGVVPWLLLRRGADVCPSGIRWLGLFPAAAGISVYLACAWDFAIVGRGTPAPIDPPKTLVTKGLYRRMRNPMYAGVLLLLGGEAMLFASARLVAYAAAVWLVSHLFIVFHEEPTLARKFGAGYQAYRQNVPRWIPRRRGGR